MRDKTTWREELEYVFKRNGETLDHTYKMYPEDLDLDKRFDAGFGGSEGQPFTIWTNNYVYFPAVYDGSEWVESVPRHPCKFAKEHVGGQ